MNAKKWIALTALGSVLLGSAPAAAGIERPRPSAVPGAETTMAPNALIVVAKIIPLTTNNARVMTFNNAITPLVQQRITAGKHVVLVDQYTGFPNNELGDGIHPNTAGYVRMAGVWYAAISGLLP